MITSTLGQRKRARTWCFPQSPGKDSSLASRTWSRSKHARVCFHCDHRSARNLSVNVLGGGVVSGQGQISAYVGIRGLSKHRRADLGVESQGVPPPQKILRRWLIYLKSEEMHCGALRGGQQRPRPASFSSGDAGNKAPQEGADATDSILYLIKKNKTMNTNWSACRE